MKKFGQEKLETARMELQTNARTHKRTEDG
jgi:hypothetical protein